MDIGEVTVCLQDTDQAELTSKSDDLVYNNLPTERNVYKIPIENLKEVINEKLQDEGFKKEYEVRHAVLYIEIENILCISNGIRSYSHVVC